MEKITIEAQIKASKAKVWEFYTEPKHIVNWNFADPSWCCPRAENDLKVGGIYNARMEAKDGSFGFDFHAIYSKVSLGESFSYGFENRNIDVYLEDISDLGEPKTKIVVSFDPENQNPLEMQRAGWQAILDNFKNYVERS